MRGVAVVLGLCLPACAGAFDLDVVEYEAPPACPSPVGHDEDADLFDDACDVCPAFADPGQEDADRDGVGDACDPSPDDANELVRFITFANSTDMDYFTESTAWTISDDAMSAPPGMHYMEFVEAPPASPFEVQLGVTLTTVDRTMYGHVQLSGAVTTSVGPRCEYYHVTSGADTWHAVGGGNDNGMMVPVTFVAGTRFVARARYTQAALDCVVGGVTMAGQDFDAIGTVPLAQPVSGKVAIQINQVAVRLEWFAIYGTL